MNIAILIAVASGLLQMYGYVVYNHKAKKGDIKPNSASWAIWTFGSLVNLASYAVLTQDWVKDILPIACSVACIATFAICLYAREFNRLEKEEWAFLLVDVGITIVWYFTSAAEANLLYQVGTIISFIPMILSIKRGESKEAWLPWVIWTIAYALFGTSVLLRLNSWTELVYPVTCFVMHGYMALISWRNRFN